LRALALLAVQKPVLSLAMHVAVMCYLAAAAHRAVTPSWRWHGNLVAVGAPRIAWNPEDVEAVVVTWCVGVESGIQYDRRCAEGELHVGYRVAKSRSDGFGDKQPRRTSIHLAQEQHVTIQHWVSIILTSKRTIPLALDRWPHLTHDLFVL
jgi:hypothetical protein